MNNIFLEPDIEQDNIVRAILYTLGDPRPQGPDSTEEVRALKNGKKFKALKENITRHQALNTLMNNTNIEQIVPLLIARLENIIGSENIASYQQKMGKPLTHNNIIDFAYNIIALVNEEQAQQVLSKKTPQYHFRYSKQAPPKQELTEFIDYIINAALIKEIMAGLNLSVAGGQISKEDCIAITNHILDDGINKIIPSFIQSLEKEIQKSINMAPDKPLIYLSIGCGSGRADTRVVTQLKRNFPDTKFQVFGFDPFQKEPNINLIVNTLGGNLINRELTEEETYISIIKAITGDKNPLVIATEKFALHHAGRSAAKIIEEIENTTLISVEEPVTERQIRDIYRRLAACSYDVLANYAFEVRFGGTWITEARKKPELFGALYRRVEMIEAQMMRGVKLTKIQDVFPRTFIITYPTKFEIPSAV